MIPQCKGDYGDHVKLLRDACGSAQQIYVIAQAELDGFTHAGTMDSPLLVYSYDLLLRKAYLQAFRAGKNLLAKPKASPA